MMESSLSIRVRYNECDPMGVVHHAVYPVWFEMGRAEQLRKRGLNYKDLEKDHIYFVVSTLNVKYHSPARYDDALTLTTTCTEQRKATLFHTYELRRGDIVLTKGETVIACVNQEGRVQKLPEVISSLSK
tara:strand:+ start:51 stop:440 length:390 start_codon:yes stop_codon:yes gene_type:complete